MITRSAKIYLTSLVLVVVGIGMFLQSRLLQQTSLANDCSDTLCIAPCAMSGCEAGTMTKPGIGGAPLVNPGGTYTVRGYAYDADNISKIGIYVNFNGGRKPAPGGWNGTVCDTTPDLSVVWTAAAPSGVSVTAVNCSSPPDASLYGAPCSGGQGKNPIIFSYDLAIPVTATSILVNTIVWDGTGQSTQGFCEEDSSINVATVPTIVIPPTAVSTPCVVDIGGYVFNDVNMDGVWQNDTEPGVNDVHVLLENWDGAPLLPLGCIDKNKNGRIDALTYNEALHSHFFPVAITGGDPWVINKPSVSPSATPVATECTLCDPIITPFPTYAPFAAGTPYWAGGVNPGPLRNQNIWNPVVLAAAPASQVSAIRSRLPDLSPRVDIDFTGKYLYSRLSGYYEFQNLPLGSYKARILTSIEQQEEWGMYKIDNRFYFPFPRPLQFTAPEYREIDLVVTRCANLQVGVGI